MFDWTWGTFGTTHFVTLIAAIALIFAIYVWLHDESRKKQIIVLFFLSLSGIAAIIYNLVAWGTPWEYLPLHLCSLNALLLPYAVLTRQKWCCNLLLLWSLGSYVALILNNSMADATVFSMPFNFYYFPHLLEAGIPIILFKLGLVKRDHKCIKSTIIITFAVYTVIHLINVAINSGLIGPGDVQVNYMFSITPNNPVLNLFWSIIPSSYWYMFLAIPVIIVYLAWWYLPELLEAYKSGKSLREKKRAIREYYDEYKEEYVEEIIDKKYK
jgi:uncharacterized membrane protein YwaF